jgi:hypothetical protein
MCTVSSDIKEALNISIHNLHPDLELTSPVYFSNGTTCHVSPSQQTYIGTIMETSFGIAFMQKDFKGALLYKLQRNYPIKTGDLPDNSITFIEDTTTNIYLLVAWNTENAWRDFYACLIECDNDFLWDEDKLWALHCRYDDKFYLGFHFIEVMTRLGKPGIATWLIHGGTIMKARFNVTYGPDYKLDIVIYEGTGKYDMKSPVKIDQKRLVLPLPILIVLIYVVRLAIPSSIKLNIHNQCLNVDLVSPIYGAGTGLECHRAPDRKVYAGSTTKSAFIIESDDVFLGGTLIYGLQRRQTRESTEINEDKSNTTYLLVVWEISESKYLYADVLLIEHDEKLDWNKYGLKYLYRDKFNQFRWFPYSATETWSLDDNVVLMTTLEIMDEDRILDITISEVERDNCTRIPVHIDPER